MEIVSTSVARPLEVCWRVFTDHSKLTSWVPGLRRVQLVAARPDGLPEELTFEYAAGLSYALRYSYDLVAHVIRWEPNERDRGGVRGFARFTEVEGGTELTYALEHDTGRKAAERMLDDPRMLVEAFARRLHEDRD
jgi:hypothetical protein